MQTKIIKINEKNFSKNDLKEAIKLLKKGEIVVFPTETVYGIGANAFDKKAVKKIFKAKKRPSDNPLIVHISNLGQLDEVAFEVPKKAELLIKKFWPGPLTLILKKSKKIPKEVTAGLDSVAVRMPSHKVARSLIKECGFAIAAPSANLATMPSSTIGKHALDDLNGIVPLIIDSGFSKYGIESTVLSLITKKPILLRPGTITKKQIEKEIGKINLVKNTNKNINEKPISPGLKYKHYSPKAKVILVMNKNHFKKKVIKVSEKNKVGVISFSKKLGLENEYFFNNNKNLFAKKLFYCFRELDKKKVDFIIIEGIKEEEIGVAIINRIKKASFQIC